MVVHFVDGMIWWIRRFRRVASYIIRNGLMLTSRREGADNMARRTKEDAGERRTAIAAIHLTPSEYAELKIRADKLGMSRSAFARLIILSDEKAPAPNARDPATIRALAVEISRVGNNVNQLAHVANERRALPLETQLQEVSGRIIAALEKVMQL